MLWEEEEEEDGIEALGLVVESIRMHSWAWSSASGQGKHLPWEQRDGWFWFTGCGLVVGLALLDSMLPEGFFSLDGFVILGFLGPIPAHVSV